MAAGYVREKIRAQAAAKPGSMQSLARTRLIEARAQMAAASVARRDAPADIELAPYQRTFCADPARFRSVVKARRCGGSFAASYSAALRLAGLRMTATGTLEPDPAGGVPQRFVSHSEEGAVRLVAETHGILEQLDAAGQLPRGITIGDLAATRFRLSNGIDATAHAGDGRTVRGEAGDVTLDEFAYARDPGTLWRAVKSVSDPTLARPDGYRVTVVTTPWIADSLPFSVCVASDSADEDRFRHFSRYSWPLSYVVTQGFPRTMTAAEQLEYVESTRAELGDDSAFETEYEGAWLSHAEMFLERELLQRARYDVQDLPTDGREVAGVDVARKGKHLTAIARVRIDPVNGRRKMYALPVETLRGVDFATQEEAFARVINGGCARLAIDSTGIGMAPSEALARRFPGKVTSVTFTAAIKEQLASTLRLALEEGRLLLPHSPELLRDLASLRRIAQPGGGFRYDASDKGGSHADRAWALALAVHIASVAEVAPSVSLGAPMASASMGRSSPMGGGSWRGSGF